MSLWLLRFIYHSGTRREREREKLQILFSSRRRGRLAGVWLGIIYPRQASRPNSLNLAPGVSSLSFLFFLSETLPPILSLFIFSPFLAKRKGYVIQNRMQLRAVIQTARATSTCFFFFSFFFFAFISLCQAIIIGGPSSPTTFLSFLRFSSRARVFMWKFYFVLYCSNQFDCFMVVFINVV